MKIYKYNKNSIKWYKKINYVGLIIIIILTFAISLLFFNYIGDDFARALSTSIKVTILIFLYFFIGNFLEHRDTVYVVDKDKTKFIERQKGVDGSILNNMEYKDVIDNTKESEILKNSEKYEGINTGTIEKVLKIRKSSNKAKVITNVKAKLWKIHGLFTIKKTELVEKEYKKKFVIYKDYDNYEELIKHFEKL